MASPTKAAAAGGQDNATRRMGKYELGKVLGTGSFSKVRECFDTTTKEMYAVKIIDKTQLAKEHLEEQLKREISILKQLRHRFVCSMKEVLQTTRHIYIVLELVTGGELFDKIVRSERLPEDTARRYFQQLIIAVRHCHKHGIAHRDLKPENLLLDKHGDIKVSDFGLANLQYREGEMMRTVVGTPNYVAPEVIRQTNVADKAGYNGQMADIWSCGIILYVMLSGHQAFDDKSLKALFNKIERGQYQMSRYFSEGARKLIAKILVVDPKERYTINDIINDPWFRTNFDASTLDIGVAATKEADPTTAVETIDNGLLSPQASALQGDITPGSPGKGVQPIVTDDAFNLSFRLFFMQSAAAATAVGKKTIPGPSVSPSTTALPPTPSAASSSSGGPSDRNVRGILYRGSTAQTVEAVYSSLATFVPAFVRPAMPSTEIRGHAVFKSSGKGGVLTYLIEVRPVQCGGSVPMCFIELKYGIGEKSEFNNFFESLVAKLDASRIASSGFSGLPESIVTKRVM